MLQRERETLVTDMGRGMSRGRPESEDNDSRQEQRAGLHGGGTEAGLPQGTQA